MLGDGEDLLLGEIAEGDTILEREHESRILLSFMTQKSVPVTGAAQGIGKTTALFACAEDTLVP